MQFEYNHSCEYKVWYIDESNYLYKFKYKNIQ